MIPKILGAVLVLLVAVTLSRIRNRRIDGNISQLSALCSLISFFRLQIDLFCTPVGEIFRRADKEMLKRCRFKAEPTSARAFTDIETSLSSDMLECLASFSSELGALYRDEQIKSCDCHLAKLKEKLARLEKDAPNEKKLNTVLFLCAAVGIIILFI